MSLSLVLATASLLTSAVTAWFVSQAPISAARLAETLRRDYARTELKLDCLRRVIAYRSAPATAQWLSSLNEIVVAFNDSPVVVSKLKVFARTIFNTGGHKNEELVDLIKAMMDALGIERHEIDDDLLLRPFSLKQQ